MIKHEGIKMKYEQYEKYFRFICEQDWFQDLADVHLVPDMDNSDCSVGEFTEIIAIAIHDKLTPPVPIVEQVGSTTLTRVPSEETLGCTGCYYWEKAFGCAKAGNLNENAANCNTNDTIWKEEKE